MNQRSVDYLSFSPPNCSHKRCPAFAQAMRAANVMSGNHPHPTVADFVIPQVLVLSYTAYDMAPFARDLGYLA